MRDYVVEGNTVRQLERVYREPFSRPVSETVRKNREKAAHMNVGYVAFLLLMAGILFVGCTAYINLRNQITEKQKTVESLQSKVAAMKLANDEEYDRIMGSVDMEEIKKIAVQAFQAIDGEGYARVDFFVEKGTDRIFLNEINTLPGFTKISMFPMLWEAAGLSYPDTIERIIELGYERYYDQNNRQAML